MSIEIKTKVTITATIEFNEGELRALDAMAGYGTDAFLNVFYEKLGKAYMQPYESNLRGLFEKIKDTVPGAMRSVKEAREKLSGTTTEPKK